MFVLNKLLPTCYFVVAHSTGSSTTSSGYFNCISVFIPLTWLLVINPIWLIEFDKSWSFFIVFSHSNQNWINIGLFVFDKTETLLKPFLKVYWPNKCSCWKNLISFGFSLHYHFMWIVKKLIFLDFFSVSKYVFNSLCYKINKLLLLKCHIKFFCFPICIEERW